MAAEHKRLHVFYKGRVQGVGFRFTADELAMDLDLTGWVKNLPDGRVELVCEGRPKDLETVLKKIDDQFSGYIYQKEVAWQPATQEFDSFKIEFF